MQKHYPFISIVVVFILFLQLTSCKKIDNILHGQINEELKLCNIKQMNIKFTGFADIKTFNFAYDSHNNPLSRLTATPNLGTPNMYFLYNEKERLSEIIEAYGFIDPTNFPATFAFELWIKYTYGSSSKKLQPIADTVYEFGGYQNGHIVICNTCPPKIIENYEYDAEGRVSKVISNRLGVISTVEYKYNSQGNLIRSGVLYDDKINIHRTNGVWMLFDKDYSRNNSFIAKSYNSKDLPEIITNQFTTFLNSNYIIYPFSDATINYMCDEKLVIN